MKAGSLNASSPVRMIAAHTAEQLKEANPVSENKPIDARADSIFGPSLEN
jgi:hypothetical protein